ncbi:MFS transporter permease [Pandoraea terrae]|uniref:MFS transporter permease n=1 Tax=Pandoraea terrae TaxID=1537710 RepID=A0A5E4Y2T3_9BURK|nr:MFS transporter [Pandoraea terrae]VVE42999.1 MFS transporter permease [Pandoraea terrae]
MIRTEALVTEDALTPEASAYRKATWRLIPFLAVCFLFAYFDRVNISFAKLQMQNSLGLSDAANGLGAGIYFIGYFLFEIPSNIILERVGARRWIARIMISWGLASAAMMMVTSETWFYVLRFVIGATEAGFLPGVILYFTWWFPAKRRARINALFLTSVPVSGVLGGPIAGFIMTRFDGVFNWAGWQWLFLLEGLPTVLLGFAVLVWLDDRPENAKWLTPEERAAVKSRLTQEAPVHATHDFRVALRQPATLLLSVIFLFILIGMYGITFWMPELIKNTGIADPMIIGLLTALPFAAGTLSMVIVGRHSDRTGERRLHLGLTVMVASIGYVLSGYFGDTTSLAIASLALAAVGVFGCLPVFWTMPPKFLSGPAAAGGIAMINSIGNLGGAISPYLVGKIRVMTGSTTLGLYAIAGVALIAALLILLALPREYSRDASHS